MNRERIRWALGVHLDRLEAANRLARLRGPDGKPIETYEVQRRRVRYRHDMFLETARRWAHRQPGVWGWRIDRPGYGPHFDRIE